MNTISKTLMVFAVIFTTAISISTAQIKNAKTETVKVYGNCGMCKTTIEKAGKTKNVSKVVWNEDTKMATITYDVQKTSKDDILKKIALAGYDSDKFLAPDAVYDNLHGCCQYDRVSKVPSPLGRPEVKDMSKMNDMANAKEPTVNAANMLQPVYDAYFSLKDALVKTDANTASAKAKDLQTVISDEKMEKLAMDVHMVWMKVLDDLKTDAEHINDTKDISQQREHFISLSKNIYSLIKVSKPTETVYFQHCPMANDGKGADWLSKESVIENPYYGSMMMNCGKTIETIK